MVVKLLAKPPQALRLTQKLLRQATSDEIVHRMELESSHFSERLKSPEVAQAIAAFFQRKSAG
jgi:enoyl-CoA hydratase/carnithine racemase